MLLAAWFKPSALTAGRYLWGLGSGRTTGLRVAASTSELEAVFDALTTDPVHTTSGAGITTGVWRFVSVWLHASNTTNCAVRIWLGDEAGELVEVPTTVTTARSGNMSAGSTYAIGNRPGASVAFEGLIGPSVSVYTSTNHPGAALPVSSAGSISQSEADAVLERIVRPIYRGQFTPAAHVVSGGAASSVDITLVDLNSNSGGLAISCQKLGGINITIFPYNLTSTPAGPPTWTAERPPNPPPYRSWPTMTGLLPDRRRRL